MWSGGRTWNAPARIYLFTQVRERTRCLSQEGNHGEHGVFFDRIDKMGRIGVLNFAHGILPVEFFSVTSVSSVVSSSGLDLGRAEGVLDLLQFLRRKRAFAPWLGAPIERNYLCCW
jgi:hypothetical protein